MTIGTIGLMLAYVALTFASPHMRTEKACHAGSAAIKELLLRHDEWYHILRFPVSFDYVYEGITGSPMNPIRDDILCDFDNVTSADELEHELETRGYSRVIFELVYNFMAVRGVYYIAWLDSLLQNPENDIKMLQHLQDLLIHIGESGMFSMNPEGFKWMLDVIGLNGWELFFDEDELSTDSTTAQVARVTNDIRKVWNDAVLGYSEERPNASEWLRDQVDHWTGIYIPVSAEDPGTHDYMRLLVSDILITAKSDIDPPLIPLYNLLKDHRVLNHLTVAACPVIANHINKVESIIIQNTSDPDYADPYDSIISDDIRLVVLEVIDSLRRMGLLDL